MQERLPFVHGCELLSYPLEQLLDRSAVAYERASHCEPAGWNVADSGLDVVGNPLDKIATVLVLHVQDLLVDLLHGHAATEDGGHCQVAAVAWIAGRHHVFSVEHLLGELRDAQSAVLLTVTAGQRRKARDEKVQARERDHVHGQLPQISIQLK